VSKAATAPGWELPQQAAQLVDLPLAGPDQALVGAGQHLDRLGQLTVPGDRAVVVPVGPDQVGQHLGVPRIGLGPRHLVAVAVAADRQRIDGIDLVAGRHQRPHKQATVGLGPHHHLGRVLDLGGQQLVEHGQPGQPLGNPLPSGHAAELVHHHHVMVLLGPVQPDKQHLVLLGSTSMEPEEARDTLMEKCSTHGTPPHQSSAPSATSEGTI
jgi:hypothetical protein